MLCRHCEKRPANRPRGLCSACYCNDGVRRLYPSTSIYAVRHDTDRMTEEQLDAFVEENRKTMRTTAGDLAETAPRYTNVRPISKLMMQLQIGRKRRINRRKGD